MNSDTLNFSEVVFPLFGGTKDQRSKVEGFFSPNRLVGTAFYLGGKCYATAGHVLDMLFNEYSAQMMFFTDKTNRRTYFIEITEYEIFEDLDIGIFKVDHYLNKPSPFHSVKKFCFLDDVYTAGYPFGYDSMEQGIYLRAFKGYIISEYRFMRNNIDAQCYELSFSCPRGISGAPLLSRSIERHSVLGIIIGNGSTEIELYNVIEEVSGYQERKTEVMKYGIAVSIKELVKKKSKLLNRTVREHLEENQLVIQ